MTLTLHQADTTIPYDWYTSVPYTIAKSSSRCIWVAGLHGNLITDEYHKITTETQRVIDTAPSLISLAEQHEHFLLVPVFPQPFTADRASSIYTVSLPRSIFSRNLPGEHTWRPSLAAALNFFEQHRT